MWQRGRFPHNQTKARFRYFLQVGENELVKFFDKSILVDKGSESKKAPIRQTTARQTNGPQLMAILSWLGS